jgi:pyruvate/2-oxoglutarate dehydrogenase complex dihydrolipoamide acyltransferase (E2) component
VIVVVALAIAAIAGTSVFVWRQSLVAQETETLAALEADKALLDAKLAALESQIASASASASAAAAAAAASTSATTTPSPASSSKPTPAPTSVKELALVKTVTWSSSKGYRVTADYVQLLTGKAAADAATAAGQESPPPNDYFILNSSTKLRTLALPKSTPVYVLAWAGAGATTKTKIPVGQFMDIMPGGTNPQPQWEAGYYWLTVKNGSTITRIEQQYFP